MHCHLRLPDAMPLPSYNFWDFAPELQRSPKPFHLDTLCGATVMPLAAYTVAGNEAEY